jgi:hypothetical protein
MGQVSCQKLPFAGKLPEQDDSTQALLTIGESSMAYIKKRGEYWRAEVRRKEH